IYHLSPWPLDLFDAQTMAPLVDTDADGAVDTGPLAESAQRDIRVEVQTPSGAVQGDRLAFDFTVRSSLDSAQQQFVSLEAALPVPFLQSYRDLRMYENNLLFV